MNPIVLKNLFKKKEKPGSVKIGLIDFEVKQILGQGAFGKVRIIEQVSTKQLFALKYMSKLDLIKTKSVRNAFRERIILESLTHPYILSLKYVFQDEDHLYYVMDWAKGGDLEYALQQNGPFSEDIVRMFAAELSSALLYMHNFEVVHRDLKPANILLTEDGHMVISDFNCSISLKERTPNSKSGTLEYMAPEMFTGKPYTYSVDWWALGVKPFKDETPEKTQANIMNKVLTFKQTETVSRTQIIFMTGLLERNISARIGVKEDLVYKHAWFEGVDFAAIENKAIPTGYVPKKGDNFEPHVEGACDDDLLSQKLMSARSAREKGSFSSKFSTFISKKSRNSSHSSNMDEKNGKLKDVAIELELMDTYLYPYDYERKDKYPTVVLPEYYAVKPNVPKITVTPRSRSNSNNSSSRLQGITRQKTIEKTPSPLGMSSTIIPTAHQMDDEPPAQ